MGIKSVLKFCALGLACALAAPAGAALGLRADKALNEAAGWWALGLMASIGLYSARKRLEWLSRAGSMKFWFGWHLFAGIAGPALAFAHSGMSWHGAANSNMALASLLAVYFSGAAGLYLLRAAGLARARAGTSASASQAKALARLESALGAWRLLHYPLLFALALCVGLHAFAYIAY